jgi:hypothetical protein
MGFKQKERGKPTLKRPREGVLSTMRTVQAVQLIAVNNMMKFACK